MRSIAENNNNNLHELMCAHVRAPRAPRAMDNIQPLPRSRVSGIHVTPLLSDGTTSDVVGERSIARDDAVRGHRPSATISATISATAEAPPTVAHRDIRQHRPERGTRPHHTELPETAATCCSDWARHVLLRHVLLRRRCVLSTQTAASFLCETTFIRRTARVGAIKGEIWAPLGIV